MTFKSISLCATMLAGFAVTIGGVAVTAHAQTPGTAPAAAPASVAEVKPTVVLEPAAATMPVALWTDNGKPMVARGAAEVATAPASSVKASVSVYPLGGFTFREVTFPKGAKFNTPMGPMDTVAYVVRGKMKIKLGTMEADVGPGSAWRKISGQISSYEILEETVLLETDAKPEDRK